MKLDGSIAGYAFSHVDDFRICGAEGCPYWKDIKAKIVGLYNWGMWKRGFLRFAGIDFRQERGYPITLSQSFYVSGILDLAVLSKRVLRPVPDGLMQREVSECRRALGEIPWLATQTAPLLAARCGILQSGTTLNAPPAVLELCTAQ